VDVDDLRLVRALQLAPRASFARLAEALGAHERTVSRRYARLRRDGVVRVVGVVNPMAVGQQLWQVRVRCRPDAAESLAAALAARDDIAWVAVTAAGAEVLFSVRSLSAQRRDLLLTRGLPRSAHVLDVAASLVVHVFLGLHSGGWSGLGELLSTAEVDRLTDADPAGPGSATARIEPPDAALLAVLADDGRAGTARLATAAGISEGRAARRLATLIRTRALVIDVDLGHEALGVTVGAQLNLAVTPGRLSAVGAALARRPEAGHVVALSGRDNLAAAVACRDLDHLYAFSTEQVGRLDGVTAMEIVPLTRIVKQSGELRVAG
jgi:DNA-binding Lrp family transcriptional regulator